MTDLTHCCQSCVSNVLYSALITLIHNYPIYYSYTCSNEYLTLCSSLDKFTFFDTLITENKSQLHNICNTTKSSAGPAYYCLFKLILSRTHIDNYKKYLSTLPQKVTKM